MRQNGVGQRAGSAAAPRGVPSAPPPGRATAERAWPPSPTAPPGSGEGRAAPSPHHPPGSGGGGIPPRPRSRRAVVASTAQGAGQGPCGENGGQQARQERWSPASRPRPAASHGHAEGEGARRTRNGRHTPPWVRSDLAGCGPPLNAKRAARAAGGAKRACKRGQCKASRSPSRRVRTYSTIVLDMFYARSTVG